MALCVNMNEALTPKQFRVDGRRDWGMSASNGVAVLGTKASEVEVVAKATRRWFSAEYKLKTLREAEACTKPGAIGALLRREGLYSSNVTTWRRSGGPVNWADRPRRSVGPCPGQEPPGGQGGGPGAGGDLTNRPGRGPGRAPKKVAELLGIALPRNGGKP